MCIKAPCENKDSNRYKTFYNIDLPQTTNNFFNKKGDSYSSDLQESVGGAKGYCQQFLGNIGQIVEHQSQSVGEIMEELSSRLENIKRTGVPLFLDPKNATFLDVAIHAKVHQYLSESTIEKHIRYARFMELHPQPVDFKNLTPESFIKHVIYRLEIEDPPATPNALKHEKKAVLMFLKAFRQYTEDWKEYVKTPPIVTSEDNTYIPFPSTVNKLYHAKYSDDKYENVLLQTIVFMGFNFGMRPPSEICNLNLEDIAINKDGTGYIRIHEDKKHRKHRLIYPYNKTVLSSPVFKTPKNYIKNWRHKVVKKHSGNALFLQPDGKRVTKYYLRDHIAPIGKRVCNEKSFILYTMRHTFATYLYEYTKDMKKVAKRLGHKKSDTVDKYVHIADSMKEQLGKRNLFNQALRSIKPRGKQGDLDCWEKRHQSDNFSPRNLSGPAEI